MRCTWKKEKPVEIDIRPGAIWMVRRNIFDHFLVQQAVQQGATLRDQTPAEGIECLGHCWQVNTPEDCIQGKYLIAADGSKGPLARWLGFKHRKHFAGAALEVEVTREHLHHPHAEIEFGLLNHGYLWNFPKADGYSMGIGKFSRGQSGNLRAVLKDYATEFEIENILNWFIPSICGMATKSSIPKTPF
ncbi:hypothetical protein PMG25_18500 [Roseofilum sp. BLCC_M114]|uniref:Geranylgeranyl reductase n=1 Tax=Roseofilum capinflatum BLCC-M114 TaxID=3022440 RepID=A0ABT7BCQ6_9CYAN|nr:hypothetical protein [Roseofilum capinflatum]MDJ1176078.1 hypothetical protein [Roseofilum capinflatum BLCC-M114]